jgi:hypothetical protein
LFYVPCRARDPKLEDLLGYFCPLSQSLVPEFPCKIM